MSDSTDSGRTAQNGRRAPLAAWAMFALAVAVGCDVGKTSIGTAASPSPDASLRALSISAGTLTPAFDSARTSYAVAVTAGTASVTVTPAATSTGATIAVNGSVVTSGNTSPSIALGVGTTTIQVVVTGADAVTVRTYTISVVRATAAVLPGT